MRPMHFRRRQSACGYGVWPVIQSGRQKTTLLCSVGPCSCQNHLQRDHVEGAGADQTRAAAIQVCNPLCSGCRYSLPTAYWQLKEKFGFPVSTPYLFDDHFLRQQTLTFELRTLPSRENTQRCCHLICSKLLYAFYGWVT